MFEIGSSLREARTRQGLQLEEMEVRTKVRAKYLRALEEERFDQLPAHTYVKGFLRTYADALGMEGRLYVDEYNSRFVAGEDDQPLRTRRVQEARGRRQQRESHLVLVALAAIVIVTALVIAAWKFGSPSEPRVQGLNAAPTAPLAARKGRVLLEVRAVLGRSFVEVRADSRSGRPLYRGTLARGQTKRFTWPRLYVSVATPANVVVRANGNRVRLPAGGERVVTSRTALGS